MKFFVLNGPNLNLLGSRQPEVYGTTTLAEVEEMCQKKAADLGVEIEFRQTNSEGTLIDWLHEAREQADGVVLNPAAFTHYSLALREAVSSIELPVVEVHISNIYGREPWRAKSVVSPSAKAVIAGAGVKGYLLAIEALAELINKEKQ
jgi:3-dehydroquinate dehydratase-2